MKMRKITEIMWNLKLVSYFSLNSRYDLELLVFPFITIFKKREGAR